MVLRSSPGEVLPDPQEYAKALVRKPKVHIPGWLYFPGLVAWWLGKVVAKVLWWTLVRLGYLCIPVLGVAYLFVFFRWPIGSTAVALPAGLLALWWWQARASFWRWIGWFYLAQWRRWAVYRRLWFAVCANLNLAVMFDRDRRYPKIVKVRRDTEGDLITVKMLPGQHPNDWTKHAARFAHTYDVQSCTVRTAAGRRGRSRVVLHMCLRDSLAKVVAPFAVSAFPDLAALAVALRSGGHKVTISLITHVLVAGASGAGKGSVLWAILSALASTIRNGLVQVHAFDPKAGVELVAGEPLFGRFHYGTAEEMAGALEDLVKLMKRRQDGQRGRGRTHIPTVAEPSIVIMVDEFGSLTSYVDKKIKDRINLAMSLILSQGRAAGVHVVAALQDPRKEILPFRNLFATRIALRLNEESEVGMVLDDDAVDRGAACHLIPKSLPGTAYLVLEDDPQPVRVRFPYHTDLDIADLASAYAPTVSYAPAALEVNR